jgi:membrane protein
VGIVLVGLVLVGLVVSGPVAESVGRVLGLGGSVVTVWNLAKWPVILLIVVLLVGMLYQATPNVRQPRFRWLSVGAAIAILTWILASAAFGLYVANFGSYNKTYGSLAGVVVFLLWLWLTNLALLFGAEVDAELERSRQLQSGIEAEETLQLPPRDTRVSEKKARKREEQVAQGRRLREKGGRR